MTGVTLECRNSHHKGRSKRTIPSVLHWLLRTTAWVPATVGHTQVIRRPEEVWISAKGMHQHVRRWLPILEHRLAERRRFPLWDYLGGVDTAKFDGR